MMSAKKGVSLYFIDPIHHILSSLEDESALDSIIEFLQSGNINTMMMMKHFLAKMK